jgi:hypothetical protein
MRSALRATIIPWGHPSTPQPPPGDGYGKPLSLIALLPAAAGVRRLRAAERQRPDELACEAKQALPDDGGTARP